MKFHIVSNSCPCLQSLVTDAAGTVIAETRYTLYGETRFTSGTSPTDYLYTSQRQEAGLGLYFYNARWFDPYQKLSQETLNGITKACPEAAPTSKQINERE